ncbi:MAG: DUF4783 domain-containing protein, partial [Bacteroidetes bacterium]
MHKSVCEQYIHPKPDINCRMPLSQNLFRSGAAYSKRQPAIMKKFIWIFGLLLFAMSAEAQSVEDITGALKQGNVEVLARYLDRNVEIAIPGKDDMVSKDEAAAALRQFFGNHHPRSFSEMHQGR